MSFDVNKHTQLVEKIVIFYNNFIELQLFRNGHHINSNETTILAAQSYFFMIEWTK